MSDGVSEERLSQTDDKVLLVKIHKMKSYQETVVHDVQVGKELEISWSHISDIPWSLSQLGSGISPSRQEEVPFSYPSFSNPHPFPISLGFLRELCPPSDSPMTPTTFNTGAV